MNVKTQLFQTSLKVGACLILAFLINACVNSPKVVNTARPEHAITKEQAVELSNNYTLRYDSVSRVIGKEDNRSTWYSLEELKNYIAYVEAQGKAQGYMVDGIRFYIGAYGVDYKDAAKQNLTTIFLAPTGMKMGTMNERSMSSNQSSPDITEIDAYNLGQNGWPPHKTYGN
jgi:hypothetical protein